LFCFVLLAASPFIVHKTALRGALRLSLGITHSKVHSKDLVKLAEWSIPR